MFFVVLLKIPMGHSVWRSSTTAILLTLGMTRRNIRLSPTSTKITFYVTEILGSQGCYRSSSWLKRRVYLIQLPRSSYFRVKTDAHVPRNVSCHIQDHTALQARRSQYPLFFLSTICSLFNFTVVSVLSLQFHITFNLSPSCVF